MFKHLMRTVSTKAITLANN